MDSKRIPERKLPEFKITKEQVEELKAISSITKILAEDPELTRRLADAFVQATRVSPEDSLAAQIELKEKVTGFLVEKLKEIPSERIAKLFPQWFPHIIRYWIPDLWIPHIHVWQPWYFVHRER